MPPAQRLVGEMTDAPERRHGAVTVDTDLVEYLVVVVQDLDSLGSIAAALAELVEAETLQVLDLVAVARADEGDASVDVFELEALPSLAVLSDVEGEVGGLLSDRDIDRAAVVLEPGTAAIILVAEDRWARPLSAAARRAGGRIIAGERIPRPRVETGLSDQSRRTERAASWEEDDATRWRNSK